MSNDTEPNHVYRIRRRQKRDRYATTTTHYETERTLHYDLLQFELEVLSYGPSLVARCADIWLRRWFPKRDSDSTLLETSEIVAVEEFVDGGWVPRQYTITPPELRIEGRVVS